MTKREIYDYSPKTLFLPKPVNLASQNWRQKSYRKCHMWTLIWLPLEICFSCKWTMPCDPGAWMESPRGTVHVFSSVASGLVSGQCVGVCGFWLWAWRCSGHAVRVGVNRDLPKQRHRPSKKIQTTKNQMEPRTHSVLHTEITGRWFHGTAFT